MITNRIGGYGAQYRGAVAWTVQPLDWEVVFKVEISILQCAGISNVQTIDYWTRHGLKNLPLIVSQSLEVENNWGAMEENATE